MIEVEGVTIFLSKDDPEADERFKRWKVVHADEPDALYLNIKTSTKAMIHKARCVHAHNDNPETDGDNARHPKACCLSGHGKLREFAEANNLTVKKCRTCGTHW